jgi:hypothetical protein
LRQFSGLLALEKDADPADGYVIFTRFLHQQR